MVAEGAGTPATPFTVKPLASTNASTPLYATTVIKDADRFPIPQWNPRAGRTQTFAKWQLAVRELFNAFDVDLATFAKSPPGCRWLDVISSPQSSSVLKIYPDCSPQCRPSVSTAVHSAGQCRPLGLHCSAQCPTESTDCTPVHSLSLHCVPLGMEPRVKLGVKVAEVDMAVRG